MHDSIRIEEIAAQWLARKDGEGWGADNQAELSAWLEASIAHRVAYIRLEAAWPRVRRLKAIAPDLSLGEATRPGEWPGLSNSDRRYFFVVSDDAAVDTLSAGYPATRCNFRR